MLSIYSLTRVNHVKDRKPWTCCHLPRDTHIGRCKRWPLPLGDQIHAWQGIDRECRYDSRSWPSTAFFRLQTHARCPCALHAKRRITLVYLWPRIASKTTTEAVILHSISARTRSRGPERTALLTAFVCARGGIATSIAKRTAMRECRTARRHGKWNFGTRQVHH